MPSLTAPDTPHYATAPETKADLEYADLAIIDLAKAGTPEGRLELVKDVREAMTKQGFFYVVNHGYSPAQTTRIFDIADVPFTGVSEDEKKTYTARIKETGSFQGYKHRQYWHSVAEVRSGSGQTANQTGK